MSRSDRPRLTRNRRGEPVDPVPFLVSASLAFMLAFSIGPIYGLAYGVSLEASLAASGVAFAGIATVAYAQFVRSAPAVDAGPLPAEPRFERLLYAALALGVVLAGLTLPLL
ncbi:hypothetical protein SAMN04488066_1241 [Halorubrum aquaticum]|uniref:Uncharacterized protein n=1 Tax=Halorubrum aquaticum TaxID=387340 RepID=A0A1I3CK08_9EURY|nr:hypothetical protein [Halorubrum aquaticum]SFH74904.1 hypothetical protein SAMN04488066_1241 [Halorubrum aquaticum]